MRSFRSYLAVILLLAASTIHAHEQAAFYALSSLLFHVSETDSEISFDDQDVAQLFEKAALDPTLSDEIHQVKTLYYKTKKLDMVKKRLKTLWNKHNPYAKNLTLSPRSTNHKNFANNACIDEKMHKKIKPFLLPLDHSMRPSLDAIFHSPGINQSESTLHKAGFKTVSIRPHSYLIIVKHEQLPGYLIKIYLENESRLKLGKEGWQWLQQRCVGAQNIRNFIEEHNLKHFVVPDKWIYPLPQKNSGAKKKCGQPIALMVTEMNLVSDKESEYIWKHKVTHKVLEELYMLMSHGLASRYLSWNIPPTKDGKFACIDTEHPKEEPHYSTARKYFSDDMARYWDLLVRNGGKIDKKTKKK